MKTAKILSVLILAVLALSTFNASAVTPAPGESCAPLVKTKIAAAPYAYLNSRLSNTVMAEIKRLMIRVKDNTSYNNLAAYARLQVFPRGRILITAPDGTVAFDSSKDTSPSKNTFENFKNKTINENHNTRIAILDAQMFECGIGVETKYSTTDGTNESYVAARIGLGTTRAAASYLDNTGTVRLSVKD